MCVYVCMYTGSLFEYFLCENVTYNHHGRAFWDHDQSLIILLEQICFLKKILHLVILPFCPNNFTRSFVWILSFFQNNLTLSCALVIQSLSCVLLFRPHGLQPTRLLCPCGSPSKNAGVGCHFLLQGIFLTQGLNLGLPHCRQSLYRLSYQGSPCALLIAKVHILLKAQLVKKASFN